MEHVVLCLAPDQMNIAQFIVSGQSAEKSNKPGKYHFYGIVPTEAVLLTSLSLPTASWAKIRKAIPFVLEEQLASSLEDNHWVGYRSDRQSKVAIATVAKNKLSHWLDQFNTFIGNPLTSLRLLIPDVLCLPWEQGIWSVYWDKNRALIRTGQYQGLAIASDQLNWMLQKILRQSDEASVPSRIDIFHPAETLPPGAELSLTIPIQFHELTTSTYEFFANKCPTQSAMNLLQGFSSIQKKLLSQLKPLKWAGILFAASLAISLVGTVTQYFYFTHVKTNQDALIANIYQSVFPNSHVQVDPQARFDREVHLLQSAQTQVGYLKLFTPVAQVLQSFNQIKCQSFEFDGQQIILNINAPSLSMISDFVQQLKKQNVNAKTGDVSTISAQQVQAKVVVQS